MSWWNMVALAKFALRFALDISISYWLSPYAVEYGLKPVKALQEMSECVYYRKISNFTV